ncbi:MAG: T9SS type A sorting domain-containing protein [Ilyomonas sp.]
MTAQQESDKVVNYLDVAAKCSGLLIVKILDIQGRIAKTIKEKVEEGVNQLSLNISDLKNGRYVVNIFNNDEFIQAVRVNID